MPATKTKQKQVPRKNNAEATVGASPPSRSSALFLAAICGAALGLSAPGFDYWYIAWFGLVPLFLLIASSPGAMHACARSLVFGIAYNLVYQSWYLQLHPLDWLGFSWWQSMLLAVGAWTVVAFHQGMIIALTAIIIRALPLTGGFLPRQVEENWKLPSMIIVPLVWVICENKLGNAHDWLGVPWSMIEYSQYHQLPIIQIVSLIGGIGLSFLMVMTNVALADLIATFSQKLSLKSLACSSNVSAFAQFISIAFCIVCAYAWGLTRVSTAQTGKVATLSVLQGNINIDMEKTTHRYSLDELLKHYTHLLERVPAGICIWTESALPTYLREEKTTLDALSDFSRNHKLDMVIGSIDHDGNQRPYNLAFGIASDGMLQPLIYHKRYLVPFGEYNPSFARYFPDWAQKLTNTPAGGGFTSGKFPVVLNLSGQRIAPLICFETLSPELVSSSVRNGGELIVNLSDLAWFHNSICGDQMTAFSVLRAVENGRYFVFAANTGPSVIIDPAGRITAQSPKGAESILTGKVLLKSSLTPFTQWFN